LKILAFLALPLALVSWPVIVFLSSLVGGFCYGLFWPMCATFATFNDCTEGENNECFLSGFECLPKSVKNVVSFAKLNYTTYFDYLLEDWGNYQGDTLSLNLFKVLGCVFVMLFASILFIIVFSIYGAIMILPAIVRGRCFFCEQKNNNQFILF
jgi:hypothetical protein